MAAVTIDDARWSEAPEVVQTPPNGLGNELYHQSDTTKQTTYDSSPPYAYDGTQEKHQEPYAPPSPSLKWWQQKRIKLFLLIIAIVTIVGLVVGLAVGLTVGRSSDSTGTDNSNQDDADPKPDSEEASLCSGKLCPKVLDAQMYEDELYVFMRTADDRLAYITGNSSGFGKSWKDLGEANGKFISQPAAIAWGNSSNPLLDVLAVSSSQNAVYGRRFENNEWSDWENLMSGAASQPVVCRTEVDRFEVFATHEDRESIIQRYWAESQEFVEPQNGPDVSAGALASAPAVSCRYDLHVDLVWYDRDSGAARYNIHDEGDQWGTSKRFDGAFIGDPEVFSSRDDRAEFFGVQEDHKVYHFSRTGEDVPSDLTVVGGNVTSTPTAISLERGKLDVVALGRNGQLHHTHYDGTAWSEWEDLPFEAVSAPTMVQSDNFIYLFALGEDEVQYAIWKSDGESEWADLVEVKLMGGSPSLEFFTQDED